VAPPVSERDAHEYVSSGCPVPGTRVVVADEEGGDLPEGRVGRILLSSDSMMNGYLNAPGVAADGPRPGLLDTGDLGFMLGGELFVTGRAKDVIIIAGRNYHPQPFELAAATVDGVRPGGTAAIGLPDAERGTEQLEIVVETKHHNDEVRAQEMRREVEQTVARSTGVSPSHVVIVKPGSLPRTSSGKTQRHLVSRMLAEGGPTGGLPGGLPAGEQPGGQEPPASPTASVG
jgi:fatty-acyl-CoA synthase